MLAHVSAISKIGGRRAAPFPGWTLGSPQEGAPYRRSPACRRRELHSCNSATSAPLQGSRRIGTARGTPDLEIPGTSYIVFTRWNARKCRERQRITLQNADVAQLVEHHLAKVDVASSNLVVRSQDTVTAKVPRNQRLHGGLAERRGSGLQSRIHGFESRTHLGENHGFRMQSGAMGDWRSGSALP